MGVETNELADRVVGSFQDLLDDDTRAAVGEGNLNALRGMIREAISERSESIFDRLRQNLQQTEAEMVERTPLEL